MANNLVLGRGRLAARWLLRLDNPLPARTDAELETERDEQYVWNYTVNLLDGVFFWFGLSFISATTILPLFVSKLSDSPILIALLAVLAQSSWFLPQLFAAGITERIPRMKPVVINLGFFTERFPVVLLPLAALISLSNPLLALVIFFVAFAWHGFGAGLIAPAWSNMLARCFPVDRRGRFFGITSFIGTGLGTLGAFVSGWMLDHFPYPTNFVYIFLVAAIAVFVSWAFLALTREPAGRNEATPSPIRQQGDSRRKMLAIVRGDHNFRRFLIARVLSSFAAMGEGFLTVSAVRMWAVSDGTVAYFTAAMLLGQTGGNLLAGFVADRWGHKLSLELGYLGLAISFGLAWVAPGPVWFFVVFAVLGLAAGTRIVSGILIPLEFARSENRPSYVGISNTTMGVGSALAPLAGGLLAWIGYDTLFAVGALLAFIAFAVMHWWVAEPRKGHLFDPIATGV
ncbi:MAG: MFS transporter [Chloroflexi bacterium]|nr:MAG: MFS transporter [Chloroflexota bacterium]